MCDNLEFPSVKSSIIFTVHRIQSDTNIKLVKSRVCKGRFFNFCRFMCFTTAKKTCHIDFPEKRAFKNIYYQSAKFHRISPKETKNTDVFLQARAYYLSFRAQRACDRKTIGNHFKAPAKRSQHFNATYRNIVMCCDMLGVAGSSLKLVQFFMQHLWMLHNVVPVARGRPLKHTQHAARNPTQQCCNILRQNVAIVWPGLKYIKTHIMAFV